MPNPTACQHGLTHDCQKCADVVTAFLNTENRADDARYDRAWQIVGADPELAFARQRLSMHEIRHIIRAVAHAFAEPLNSCGIMAQTPQAFRAQRIK